MNTHFRERLRRLSPQLAVAVLAGVLSSSPARAGVIYLQPLGDQLPQADVALVQLALHEFYGVEVRTLPRVALPADAWYAPRSRYRAEKLLAYLDTLVPADATRLLGLTGVDISTTKGSYVDWGVMGLGSLDGKSGVISTFRCRKKARDALNARQRFAKTAVHEIGHTLGLEHCPTPGCLMHDAEGRVKTSDSEYDLCARCRSQLFRSGHAIPPTPRIPWPRP